MRSPFLISRFKWRRDCLDCEYTTYRSAPSVRLSTKVEAVALRWPEPPSYLKPSLRAAYSSGGACHRPPPRDSTPRAFSASAAARNDTPPFNGEFALRAQSFGARRSGLVLRCHCQSMDSALLGLRLAGHAELLG